MYQFFENYIKLKINLIKCNKPLQQFKTFNPVNIEDVNACEVCIVYTSKE